MKSTPVDVALVSMPWGPASEPTLGLAILKSALTRSGVSSHVFHMAPRLLKWISIETYELIAASWGVDEAVFTGEIDREFGPRQVAQLLSHAERHETTEQYSHPRYKTQKDICDLVLKLRNEIAPPFLEECAERILGRSPKMVGFSCMFDQTLPSVALAKKIKERSPDTFIVFGGYALEGPPGRTVAKAFPWIDALVLGDGEVEIVKLAHFALDRNRKGIASSSADRIRIASRIQMTDSPTPDYDDWFDELREIEQDCAIQIRPRLLPVESSRGCWWGQVKHCVFCGIDDDTLKYRFKPADQTLNMLETLRDKYGDYIFRFSDYIMPKAYYSDLLPRLASLPRKFRLQGELKANQTPERVQLMSDAGFIEFQPGIESFSTSVLKKMDKGVRAVDNVCLLKSGYRSNIIVDYNFLYGLPSDEVEDYERMVEQLPTLYHLIPPVGRTQTVVTRFAPLQANPGRFGLETGAVHHPCYDILFSDAFLESSGFNYDEYAYYFRRNFEYSDELEIVYSQLVTQIQHWKELHRTRFVELSYTCESDSAMTIIDSRFSDTETYRLSDTASAVYKLLDHVPIRQDLLMTAAVNSGIVSDEVDVTEALYELEEHRLIWRDTDMLFGLAVPKETVEKYRASEWPSHWGAIYV